MRRKYRHADLARDLDRSPSWVSKYAKKGMPTHSAEAARAWCRQHLERLARPWPGEQRQSKSGAAPPADTDAAGSLPDARRRRELAEARLVELQLQEREGKLCDAAGVRFAASRAAVIVVQAIDAGCVRAAAQFGRPDALAILRREFDAVRKAAADAIRNSAPSAEGDA